MSTRARIVTFLAMFVAAGLALCFALSNFLARNNIDAGAAVDLTVPMPRAGDLVQGRPLPPADGEGSTLGLQRYREGKVIAPVDVGTSQ